MESLEKEVLQWIKGDKIGDVETVKGIDNEWTVFESGGRIYTELINEFLLPIKGEPLDFRLTPAEVIKPTPKATPINTQSPIRTLFDKQKKNDTIKLNLTFPIVVPKNAIYEIISSSFDFVEVNDELESFIKDQISEDLILDSLFDSIKELVKTKYKIN